MNPLLTTLLHQQIVPAVTISDALQADAVAGALLEGGIKLMEVTFRTDATLDSIRRIRKAFPGMQVGAGTIRTVDQLQLAIDAGAVFGLSASLPEKVCAEASRLNFPYIPAVMTPTEIERAVDLGYNILKLFPAAQVGGLDYLKSLAGPYGHLPLRFIPMGGVNPDNLAHFVKLKNVIAVGGSWITPPALIDGRRFDRITILARQALDIINNS